MTNQAKAELRLVRVGEIEAFERSAAQSRKDDEISVISPSRARAWAKNPLADPDDVALIVATAGDRNIGYLGLLPGRLSTPDGTSPVSWSSTWFVDPRFSKTGAGGMLILKALGLRRDFLLTNLSKDAIGVCERMRMKPLGPLRYYELDLQTKKPLSLPVLAMRKLGYRTDLFDSSVYTALFEAVRTGTRPQTYAALLAAVFRPAAIQHVRMVERVSTPRFDTAIDRPRFSRGPDVIHWMIDHPWAVTSRAEDAPNYFFAEYRPKFFYEIFTLSKGQYVVLRFDSRPNKHRTVTVFDHDVDDPTALLAVAIRRAATFLADSIVVPASCGPSIEASAILRALFEEKTRAYYFKPASRRSALAMAENIALSLEDGDVAFA